MAAKTAVAILKEFFGYRQGQTMKDFAEEVKALSPAEKTELATLAAKELGHTLVEGVSVAKL
jgi:hypothetical protein